METETIIVCLVIGVAIAIWIFTIYVNKNIEGWKEENEKRKNV